MPNSEKGFLGKFWDLLKETYSKLALKIKLIVLGIIGFLGFLSVFFFRRNLNEKEILKLELKKLKKQIEIEKNQAVIDQNKEKISSLEEREESIRVEIEEILSKERGRDVSLEELDEFYF